MEESWLAREKSEDFAQLVKYNDNYLPGARRYDVGEKTMPTLLPGVIAALEQLTEWGVEKISQQLQFINEKIIDKFEQRGFVVPERKHLCSHMFGVCADENRIIEIMKTLAENNIFVSRRGNAMRISPHMHNTEKDLQAFLKCIDRL